MTKPVGTVVVMYSHHSRADVRADTIADFARVGCPVAHVQLQQEAPSPARNRRNAWQALRHTHDRILPHVDADGVLLIEDDIIPADTLRDWLAYIAATEDRPVTLYAHQQRWYPRRLWRVARGERPASRPEVATVQELGTWWGAQALWLPVTWVRSLAHELLMEMHEPGHGSWDTTLKHLLRTRNATLGVAVPNVVQHRAPGNLVNPDRLRHQTDAFQRDAAAPVLTKEA